MKNSTFYALLWFVAAFLIVSISSCSTSKGYDYKTHHRKAHNAKPSKCYTKHNKW
jgi:hypothetical protein